MSDAQEWTGRDDLGDDAGRRAKRRSGPMLGQRPGGDGSVVTRTPVVKQYGTRKPPSGSDAAKMLVASQEPWDCPCGRTLRHYRRRCRCGQERPW